MPTLRCFGGVALIGPDEREISFRSRKHLALLLFLASRQGQPVNRASLASFLWETEESLARHSLSQALYDLRSKVPELELRTTSGSLRLEPGHFGYEGRWFDQAIREEDLARAVHLYRGDFGTNLEGIGPEPFERWLESKRDRFRSLAQISFRRFVSDCDLRGQWGDVCLTAMRLVKLNPIDESAHSTLMRALWLHGDQQSALEHYADQEEFFHRELPGGPSRELLDLVERIRSSRPPPSPGRGIEDAELPLVGREEEFEVLRRVVRDLPHGGGVVAVSGEAGIGKTRLLEEVGRLAPVEGLTLLTSRCYSAESDVAYGPILDAVEPLARRLVEADGLDRRYYQLGHLFPDLFRLEPAVAEAEAVEPGVRRRRMFEEVADLIRSACQSSPVLWILEDLQWMDRSSASLLHYVARRLEDEPFALLLSVRSEAELGEAAERLITTGHGGVVGDRVELGPLSSEALGELIRHAARRPVDDATLGFVKRYAGGNPFYALEILRAATERKEERPHSGQTPNISMRLRDVLATRLEGLEPEAVRILEAIAVLGRHAIADHVANVAGLSLARAAEVGIDLTDRRIVKETPDRYEFAHDIAREFVYGNLGLLRRAALHLAAAEVLAKDHSVSPATMARHFARGTDRERAYEYAMRAAEASTASFAHAEAAAMGDLAAQVATSKEQKLDAQLLTFQALASGGSYSRAVEHGNGLLEDGKNLTDVERYDLNLKIARIHLDVAAFDHAAQRLAAATDLLCGNDHDSNRLPEEVIQLLSMRLRRAILLNDAQTAAEHYAALRRRHAKALEANKLSPALAVSSICMQGFYLTYYQSAIKAKQLLHAFAKAHGNLSLQQRQEVLTCQIVIQMRLGNWKEVTDLLSAELSLAERMNDAVGRGRNYTNRAYMHIECGNFTDAIEAATRALAIDKTYAVGSYMSPSSVINLATAHFYKRSRSRAKALFQEALDHCGRGEPAYVEVDIRSSLGLLALVEGRTAEAAAEIGALNTMLEGRSPIEERFKYEWLRVCWSGIGDRKSTEKELKAIAEEERRTNVGSALKLDLLAHIIRTRDYKLGTLPSDLRTSLRAAELGWFTLYALRWFQEFERSH